MSFVSCCDEVVMLLWELWDNLLNNLPVQAKYFVKERATKVVKCIKENSNGIVGLVFYRMARKEVARSICNILRGIYCSSRGNGRGRFWSISSLITQARLIAKILQFASSLRTESVFLSSFSTWMCVWPYYR